MSFANHPDNETPLQTQSARRLPSNLGRFHDGKWYCDCQDFNCLAKARVVSKDTPNRDKEFWRCPKFPDKQCEFFLWFEDESRRKRRLASYGLLDIPPPKTPASAKHPRVDDSGIGISLDHPWSRAKRKAEAIFDPDDEEPGSPLSQTIVPDDMEQFVDTNTPSRKVRKIASISGRRATQPLPTESWKGKQPATVASGSGYRPRNATLSHVKTSDLSTVILDLLRSENIQLRNSTVVKLCHTIDLEIVQHKAVVEQYEKVISELS